MITVRYTYATTLKRFFDKGCDCPENTFVYATNRDGSLTKAAE
jgi:hypothetical protein